MSSEVETSRCETGDAATGFLDCARSYIAGVFFWRSTMIFQSPFASALQIVR
jgi:hypothetical protein